MFNGMKIGVGITGSFCSLSNCLKFLKELKKYPVDIYVFISDQVNSCDTRFFKANQLIIEVEKIIEKKVICSVVEAEIFGPQIPLDLMVVYPCSANTLAKMAHGINDNAVTMAVKSTLRNQHNIVLGLCSNDLLSTSGMNMMKIFNTKHFYLVPMYQDDVIKKPNSLIARRDLIIQTMINALVDKAASAQIIPCGCASSTGRATCVMNFAGSLCCGGPSM